MSDLLSTAGRRDRPALVSDMMTTAVEFIADDASIRDAATLMGELDVGALPVGGPQDLQGILSDRDILFRVVADGRDPVGVKVREAMSSRVFTCRPDDTLADALDQMSAYQVRRLPVLDADDRVIGLVTLTDVARALLVETEAIQSAIKELTAAGD